MASSELDHDIAVRVEDLSVRFETTLDRARKGRSTLANLWARAGSRRTVAALEGVSFEVRAGSVFGVIGPNGAGKSTLLRTIAGIIPPSAGRVSVDGEVTPLLSLGVGFLRTLTGRQNIFLGGLARGRDPEEIYEHFDEVLDFAELGEAIDSPMSSYSSGMFARLAFSVAVHLEPEIIVIDEALGAGDAKFKEKCKLTIMELCERDCTVLVVSHGMGIIKDLADRCLWLDGGKMKGVGPTDETVDAYLESQGIDTGDSTTLEEI